MVSPVRLDKEVMDALSVLQRQADDRRMPLGVYLRTLAGARDRAGQRGADECPRISVHPPDEASEDARAADREFLADMESIATDLPILPADFSREDLYNDHD